MSQATMTAVEAKTFEHGRSGTAELFLSTALQCECVPYEDTFTYRRWRSQGFQVRKGEKGIKLTTYRPIETDYKNEDGTAVMTTIPKTYHVFCRCQVDEIKKS